SSSDKKKSVEKRSLTCYECGKTGHLKSECPERVCEDSADFGFIAVGTDEYASAADSTRGDCPLLDDVGKEVWIADSAAACHMTPSLHCMYDYEPCFHRSVTVANGQKALFLGFGKILLSTGSGEDKLTVSIKRVAHVPDLDVNLFALQSVVVEHGLPIRLTRKGTEITLPGGKKLLFEKDGRNDVETATRCSLSSNCSSKSHQFDPDESAQAVLAPGKMPVNRNQVDMNLFHHSHGHLREGLLRETAKQLGVTLVGKLHECKGCSMAKGLRKHIPTSTTTRAAKPLERVFMDASSQKLVESVGGMKYSFLIRDDFTRKIWMYFGKHKSDTTRAFKQYLADVAAQCIPSASETVRSDGGGEFSGSFSDLCRQRGRRQEYTPADSPEYNGVAERAIAMVEKA
ncbi:unnamed protein product, partial [Sphacelaria rigidula]